MGIAQPNYSPFSLNSSIKKPVYYEKKYYVFNSRYFHSFWNFKHIVFPAKATGEKVDPPNVARGERTFVLAIYNSVAKRLRPWPMKV